MNKLQGKIVTTTVAIGAICMLAGWGAQDSNISGDKKHSVNMYGTLETWASQAEPMKIENISVENIFKQIPMYVKPSLSPKNQKNDSTKTTAQPKTPSVKEHILPEDPKTSLIEAEIDLAEVAEIQVPFPNQRWIYQKDKNYRKVEFVQVRIISNDVKKTKTDYLVEKWKKVYCDRVSAAGPGEQKVPLLAIKSLKIEGYKDRALEESKKRQKEERAKIKRLSEKTK